MPTRTDEQLMTPAEVARLLNVTIKTISTWTEKGRFPKPIKIGPPGNGSVRWRPSDVAAWIDQRTKPTGSA